MTAPAPAPQVFNKVFVGNLAFKTREPDLAKAFEEAGYPVKGTNIIARGPRSLGYGFVELEKAEDADKAVAAMNKKEIDGRQVNVEVARPREYTPGQPRPPRAPRAPRAPRPQGQPGQQQNAPVNGTQGAPVNNTGAPVQNTRGPRPPRSNFPRRPRTNFQQGPNGAPQQGGAPAPQGGQGAPQGAPQGGRGGFGGSRRGFRSRRNFGGNNGPRAPRQPQNGEPSKTTLFVANLPFVVDDAGLLEIFEGLNVKEAHVVTRPNGRSKGYGFVTFESEGDQTKAMTTVDKSIVEGREIAVRPALAPYQARAPAPTTAPTNTEAPQQQAPVTPQETPK